MTTFVIAVVLMVVLVIFRKPVGELKLDPWVALVFLMLIFHQPIANRIKNLRALSTPAGDLEFEAKELAEEASHVTEEQRLAVPPPLPPVPLPPDLELRPDSWAAPSGPPQPGLQPPQQYGSPPQPGAPAPQYGGSPPLMRGNDPYEAADQDWTPAEEQGEAPGLDMAEGSEDARLLAALHAAQRETRLREEFSYYHRLATTQPAEAVIKVRAHLDRLAQWALEEAGVPEYSRLGPNLMRIRQLIGLGLGAHIVEVADEVRRIGNRATHDVVELTPVATVNYVNAAEQVAVALVRFIAMTQAQKEPPPVPSGEGRPNSEWP